MGKNDFDIISEIARGGQKIVYLAKSKMDSSLKVVIKDAKINSVSSLQRIMREVNFLSTLDSIYFPKNYSSYFDMSSMTMTVIEEYIEGETLRHDMFKYQTFDDIKELLNELINALEIVWNNNVVHRDLKPEKLLLDEMGNHV